MHSNFRALEERRKEQQDNEEKVREEVLAKRKQEQLEVTQRFQKDTVQKKKLTHQEVANGIDKGTVVHVLHKFISSPLVKVCTSFWHLENLTIKSRDARTIIPVALSLVILSCVTIQITVYVVAQIFLWFKNFQTISFVSDLLP